MDKRTTPAATLAALLALGGSGAVALAEDDESAEATASKNVTGTIETMTDEAGRTMYYLRVGEELVELHFGPSWFSDLGAMFGMEVGDGDEVELGGNVRSMSPNENASDTAKAKAGQKLKVKTLNGEARPKGKPAWAGGPKEQGEAHPGHEGWSKGQADKAAKAEAKAQKAAKSATKGKPARAGKGRDRDD